VAELSGGSVGVSLWIRGLVYLTHRSLFLRQRSRSAVLSPDRCRASRRGG